MTTLASLDVCNFFVVVWQGGRLSAQESAAPAGQSEDNSDQLRQKAQFGARSRAVAAKYSLQWRRPFLMSNQLGGPRRRNRARLAEMRFRQRAGICFPKMLDVANAPPGFDGKGMR